MPIKPKFNINNLFTKINRDLSPIITRGVIEAMNKTCLEISVMAKSIDTYKDQTNNLRSSIGYVIYNKGQKEKEYFNGKGAAGIAKGKAIARKAADEYPNDIVGVIVAGMDYAICVESKGFDVLTGSAAQIKSVLSKNLKAVFDAINVKL